MKNVILVVIFLQDGSKKNKLMMLQHKLNEHSTVEEREKEFKYYCKNVIMEQYQKIYSININKHKNI